MRKLACNDQNTDIHVPTSALKQLKIYKNGWWITNLCWGRWDSGIDGDGDLNNEYVLLKPDTVHRVVLLTVLFSGGWTLMPVFTVSGFMSVIVIAAETCLSAQAAPTRHQTSQLSVFHTQSQIFVPMRESRAMLRFLKAQCYRENL